MKNYLKTLLIPAIAILMVFGIAQGATVLFPYQGGLGTSTVPAYGQIPMGNGSGIYTPVATSSFGFLISGGTLTTNYHCRYDGTGIDCDRLEDASGACAANSVCMGGHTHVGVNETYGSGWNADTATPEKDDIYDYLHLIDTNDDGDIDNIDATYFTSIDNNRWSFNGTSIYPTSTSYSVSIGTTTSYTTLNIVGTNGINLFNIASSTGKSLLTMLQSGNVGIGTNNPDEILSLSNGNTFGTVKFVTKGDGFGSPTSAVSGSSVGDKIILFGPTASYKTSMGVGPDNGAYYSTVGTGSIFGMYGAPDGATTPAMKFGFMTNGKAIFGGSITPSAQVDVIKETTYVSAPTTISLANSYLQLGGWEYGGNTYRLITFGFRDLTSTNVPAFMGYKEINYGGYTNGDLVFGTRNVITDTTPTINMVLNANGYLGVGTTTPNSSLSIETPLNATLKYAQFDVSTSTPPSTDCNDDKYAGRTIYHASSTREMVLYSCMGSGGWASTTLTK